MPDSALIAGSACRDSLDIEYMIMSFSRRSCYLLLMPRSAHSKASQPVRSRAATFTLGRARFAQISAVEGVVLTPEMREMMNQFDREGLSAAERRRAILSRFAPSR